MNILFIDDSPIRAKNLIRSTDFTFFFAHGFDQITMYLKFGPSFGVIMLDHDMPLMNGTDVVNTFIFQFAKMEETSFIIHTSNVPAGEKMESSLEEYGIDVHLIPYHVDDWFQRVTKVLYKKSLVV